MQGTDGKAEGHAGESIGWETTKETNRKHQRGMPRHLFFVMLVGPVSPISNNFSNNNENFSSSALFSPLFFLVDGHKIRKKWVK